MNILSPKLLLALLIVSIAGFTNSAKSEIIVIDNFNTEMEVPGLLVNYYVGNAQQGSQNIGNIKGSTVTRDVDLTRITNTDPTAFFSSKSSVVNNIFAWSNDPGTASTTTINHQFSSAIDVLSPHGSQHGSLVLDVTNVDINAVATITLVDAGNQSATFSQSIANPGAQEVHFSYDDFLAVNSSLDLSQIKSVSTFLSQETGATAVDFEMDILAFNTPEPTSVLLFSIAGIGLTFRRRRKNA
jgi:hypothetical protein|tara:strand:- start:3155 stop:3880 length:726 start_codon:yes stop_codon:yes gene_type:complete